MKIMPNIEIDQELTYIKPYRYGSESVIINNPEKRTMYKIFTKHNYDRAGFISIKDMSDNKFNKIKRLYQKEIEDSVRPLSTLTYDGRLIGYEMTHDPHAIPFFDDSLSTEIKIYFLDEGRRILEYFATKDITFGDVAGRNILINYITGKVKFCDMDNIRLGQYPIDLMSPALKKYSNVREIDENADIYMHNLMTIAKMSEVVDYNDILDQIKKGKYPNGFKSSARKIMDCMTVPETFTGESILQYVKGKRS